jgi:hypothetical protein
MEIAPPVNAPQSGCSPTVLRARDAQKLALAKSAVEDMLERVRRAQSNSSRAYTEASDYDYESGGQKFESLRARQ